MKRKKKVEDRPLYVLISDHICILNMIYDLIKQHVIEICSTVYLFWTPADLKPGKGNSSRPRPLR